MNYQEALSYLHSRNRFAKKAGLSNMRALMERLGNPQDRLRFVHVAGTNGKGSVTTMIASILECAGCRTGKYISPFVLDFRERMQINGEMIPEDALCRCVERVKREAGLLGAEGRGPVEFEAVTAAAFLYFAEQNCDVVALEVGLGGRFDATNVIHAPLVSVITPVSLDHTEILGDTLEAIAAEKCGIIKPGGVTVCAPGQDPAALGVIMERCAETGNPLVIGNLSSVPVLEQSLLGSRIAYEGAECFLPLPGAHQIQNAATALAAVRLLRERHGFQVDSGAIRRGLGSARIPARMELFSKEPAVVLDGAHNPPGIKAAAGALRAFSAGRPVTLLTGMLGDKAAREAMALLAPLCRRVYTAAPDTPRALPAGQLAALAREWCGEVRAFGSVSCALDAALEALEPDGFLFLCGSLYLASDVRPLLLQKFPKAVN